MAEPKRTRGKGKIPGEAKENIHAVFIKLGGTGAMATWAKKNLTEFYKIYAKLLPLHLANDGGPLIIEVKRYQDAPDKPAP